MAKWENYPFESSSYKTPEFKTFASDFRKEIKRQATLYGFALSSFNIGHFYVSGFLQVRDKFIYFSCSDVRFFPNEWKNNLLYRTARDIKDFTGGSNRYCSLVQLGERAKALLVPDNLGGLFESVDKTFNRLKEYPTID